jgi:hypothetical protein
MWKCCGSLRVTYLLSGQRPVSAKSPEISARCRLGDDHARLSVDPRSADSAMRRTDRIRRFRAMRDSTSERRTLVMRRRSTARSSLGDALPMRRVRARYDVLGARHNARGSLCSCTSRTWSSRARRPRRDRRARNVGPMARARRRVSSPCLMRCQRGGDGLRVLPAGSWHHVPAEPLWACATLEEESPRPPGESRIVTAIFGHECVFSADKAPQKVGPLVALHLRLGQILRIHGLD